MSTMIRTGPGIQVPFPVFPTPGDYISVLFPGPGGVASVTDSRGMSRAWDERGGCISVFSPRPLPVLRGNGRGLRRVTLGSGVGGCGRSAMLAALWAALRVYAVGVAVTMVQLLRRLRGGFRPPGKPGSQRGRRGSRRCGVTSRGSRETTETHWPWLPAKPEVARLGSSGCFWVPLGARMYRWGGSPGLGWGHAGISGNSGDREKGGNLVSPASRRNRKLHF